MNRLIVKPIPHSSATPSVCPQLAAAGRSASRAFTRMATVPNTPTSFPTTRPAATPSVSGSIKTAGVTPAKETPALAKPKIGTIRKATGFCRKCSS